MKSPLDIVYVTNDSLIEGIGSSQIVPIVKGLSMLGWNVGVVSCEKTRDTVALKKTLREFGIAWTPISFGRRGAIGGLGRLLRLTLALPDAHMYHCRSDVAAAACALRRKDKTLWDVRSLWVDQRLVMGNISENKFVIYFGRKLESIAAKNARAITTLTKAVYPVLDSRYDIKSKSHKVIPTCTDLTKFNFSPQFPSRRKLLLSGVFNEYYDLSETRKFIAEFRSHTDLLVTWCHGQEALRTALNVGEQEIKILIQDEMPLEIANSSFGIAILKKSVGDSLKGVMPTKIAEFLATGRPVVFSSGIGDLDEILLPGRVGVVIKDDLSLAVKQIIQLLDDPDTPKRCREVAEAYFDISTAVSNYNEIFCKMGGERVL
jgi:glycosyltransferase involved in cell wall biosynthesis